MAHGVAVMKNSLETTKLAMHRFGSMVLTLCLLLVSVGASASALESLDYVSLPGNKLQLQLTFDGTPPQTKGYSIEKPARIAIDLLGATSDLKTRYHNLGTGNARSATVVQAKDRTRVIIELMRLEGYNIQTKGNQLLITLGTDSVPGNDASVAQNSGVQSGVVAIENVNFHRSKRGGGDVVITLSSSSAPVDVQQQGNKIIARFSGVALPDKLHRRLDVTDFGTDVKYIDTRMKNGDTVVTITSEGDWEYLAYQTNNTYTINVKNKTQKSQQQLKQAFQYTGEKLSLNFQNIKVRSVLQLIADFTNLNLVVSDSVDGTITLRLKNVPWDQALDLILKTQGLAKRKNGNVLLVAPAEEIRKREQAALKNKRSREQLESLRTEFISVNYAKATDIAALLEGEDSFLSKRGSVSVDKRTNTLIVQDTSDRLNTVRNLVTTLDVPVQQVLIEARVLIASSDVAHKIGVSWGGAAQASYNGGNDGLFVGSGGSVTSGMSSGSISAPPSGMVVDLGVPDPTATRFSLGFIHKSTKLLQLELSALDSQGEARLVATPKVLTADQQTAVIASGQEIPYSTTSQGGTNVQFKEAELKLEVTPHITPDNRVIMDITVNDDSPAGTAANGEIIINTQKLETSVLVDDGETVVLGGIFQRQRSHQVVKTPFLGDIPWLGALFRKKVKVDKKQELLIFITPRLVELDR